MSRQERGCHPGVIRRLGGDAGASGVEYAIMVTLVAVVVIVSVAFMGREVKSDFSCTASAVAELSSTATTC